MTFLRRKSSNFLRSRLLLDYCYNFLKRNISIFRNWFVLFFGKKRNFSGWRACTNLVIRPYRRYYLSNAFCVSSNFGLYVMFSNLVAGKRVSESDDGETLSCEEKTVPLCDQSVHVCNINQPREHTSDRADIISTANCNVKDAARRRGKPCVICDLISTHIFTVTSCWGSVAERSEGKSAKRGFVSKRLRFSFWREASRFYIRYGQPLLRNIQIFFKDKKILNCLTSFYKFRKAFNLKFYVALEAL